MVTTPDWGAVIAALSSTASDWTGALPGLLEEDAELCARSLLKRLRSHPDEARPVAHAIAALGYGELAQSLAVERGIVSCP